MAGLACSLPGPEPFYFSIKRGREKKKRHIQPTKCKSCHPSNAPVHLYAVTSSPSDSGNKAPLARQPSFRRDLGFVLFHWRGRRGSHSSGYMPPHQAPPPSQPQKRVLDAFQELRVLSCPPSPAPGASPAPQPPTAAAPTGQALPETHVKNLHIHRPVYRLHLAQRKVLISHSE